MIRKSEMRVYPGLIGDIARTVLAEEVGKGAYLKSFAAALAEFLGVKHAMLVPSDTVGMRILLAGMGLKAGDEIILPAYCSGFVCRLNAQKICSPRFIDVEAGSFNIDPDLIEAAITPRSKAVVASHMFGLPCNIEEVLRVAHKNGLKVIEDCTHSAGALSGNKQSGSRGDAAYFTFSTGSSLNALGGGAIVTCDDGLARNIQALVTSDVRSSPKFPSSLRFLKKAGIVLTRRLLLDRALSGFGIPVSEGIERECARFTNLQALIGMKQLASLDKYNSRVEEAALRYNSRLKDLVSFQHCGFAVRRVYQRYVINCPGAKPDLDKIKMRARGKGLDIGIRSEIASTAGLSGLASGTLPVSARLYASNIQLPLFEGMGASVCDSVFSVLTGAQ
ncbi:MAG: DegT/DnrJ/EryC1/StrS family aminotransferase [Candidatus Omnitrophica bacterium]|jgi:dTDP-4-amino-4,6-dideoxygalactose transaminase|nr:DegT/DnrJ/EryC1/StrS family aminotransferase [Candidatus Omnitrophota bacterium]